MKKYDEAIRAEEKAIKLLKRPNKYLEEQLQAIKDEKAGKNVRK